MITRSILALVVARSKYLRARTTLRPTLSLNMHTLTAAYCFFAAIGRNVVASVLLLCSADHLRFAQLTLSSAAGPQHV